MEHILGEGDSLHTVILWPILGLSSSFFVTANRAGYSGAMESDSTLNVNFHSSLRM